LEGIHVFLCEAGGLDSAAEAAKGEDGGMNRGGLGQWARILFGFGLDVYTYLHVFYCGDKYIVEHSHGCNCHSIHPGTIELFRTVLVRFHVECM
jgi:hypothetical protein